MTEDIQTNLICKHCEVELIGRAEDNNATWGPDWHMVDPEDLELYCPSCEGIFMVYVYDDEPPWYSPEPPSSERDEGDDRKGKEPKH